MASGIGKYDDVVTLVREMTNAACVVVVVIGGYRGDGFAQQIAAHRVVSMDGLKLAIVATLRKVADTIERDMSRLGEPPS